MALRQVGIPFPPELIHSILEDIILEYVHHRLTLEHDEKESWNSLITLSQVSQSFRSNTLHICEQLLGEPTIEQVEGSWHEKSTIQHVCEVVEHLFRLSPYHVSCMSEEYLVSFMWALLHPEYREEAKLPGLFGLYDTMNTLKIVRLSTLRWGSTVISRGPLEIAVLGTASYMLTKVVGEFRSQRLISQQLASELVLESLKHFHGMLCWIIGGKLEVMSKMASQLENPLISESLISCFCSLERSEYIAFGVQENMTPSKFRSLVGPVVSASGLILQVENLVNWVDAAGDPLNVKQKAEQYLADWRPFLPNPVNALVG